MTMQEIDRAAQRIAAQLGIDYYATDGRLVQFRAAGEGMAVYRSVPVAELTAEAVKAQFPSVFGPLLPPRPLGPGGCGPCGPSLIHQLD